MGLPLDRRGLAAILVAVLATTATFALAVAATATVAPAEPAAPAATQATDAAPVPDAATASHPDDSPFDAPAASAGTPTPAGSPDGLPANATRYNVTLVTGQTVHVVGRDGDSEYLVDADVDLRTVETNDGTYVYRSTVDFSTFDRQLFNVDLLEEQAENARGEHVTATVDRVTQAEDGFVVATDDGDRYRTEYVVAATKNAVGYL